ncbi:MAG: right-handed parallel beta-helix repeat-containing protein [Gemmatimonadota bacterium]|nr:MAG: right-handed parallel beta-helix repeat-containing protein [Gemmatimonadota bacterium]
MRYVIGFLMALAVFALAACGDGDCAEPVDVAGEWQMVSTVVSDDCGGRENQTFRMTIAQDGNDVTGETQEFGTFRGSICGDRMELNGSFPEDGGTVTVKATLVVSDGSMEGTDSWTWTDGSESCSGSDSLSAIRAAGCVDNVCPCTEAGIRGAIAEGGGLFTFDCDGPTTVETIAEILIDKDVSLDGQGELTVDGDGSHRVFAIEELATAELQGFVITNGSAIEGGGIYNLGDLSIEDCTVRGNTAEISAGIWNEGTLNLVNSTVSGNSNTGATNGAGIHNGNSANAMVTNSTVSGNTGEGIRNAGNLNLANSTVSGHSDGGIINDAGASLTLKSTLIDDDCDDQGETVSLGYNIETGNTCILNPAGSDQIDVTVDLEALADNGGPTMTHALGAGSIAAIDKIPEAECGVETDQRGQPRPETGGTMCDVGAFELQP